jgi:ribonucleoside-diphosphate reductase protein NrdI
MTPLIIVVDSMTGLGRKFADKLERVVFNIQEVPQDHLGPFLLITRSVNFGEIPLTTVEFLKKHGAFVKGVVVGGNRTWGKNFGAAGDKIQAEYHIPLIEKFEGVGFPHEVKKVKQWIEDAEQELKI